MTADILKDLIRIDTRASAGNETEAADYLKNWCDRFDIDNEIVEPIKGKGSFLAHIPGSDKSKKDLLLLSHLDTAEFGDLNKWRFHPLSAEEYKGRIVGRGAIDCKGLVSLWLSILIDIRKNNRLPKRGITFAAAANEENGGQYGMADLIKCHDWIKKSGYAIGEGGGFPLKLGDTIYYTCQNAEKGSSEYRLEKPQERLEKNKEIYLGNPVKNLINGLTANKIYNAELVRFLMKQTGFNSPGRRIHVKELLCDSYRIDTSEEGSALLLSSLPGSKKENLYNCLARAGINIRDLKKLNDVRPNFTRTDTELYRIIVSQTAKALPNIKVIPYTTPGYSDNRFLREEGKQVYGFFPLLPEDSLAGIHGFNESINIESLTNAYKLLKDIVWEFAVS